jgi:hypothetical protein
VKNIINIPKALATMLFRGLDKGRKLRRQETGSMRKIVNKNDLRPLRAEYKEPGQPSKFMNPTKQFQQLDLDVSEYYNYDQENTPQINAASHKFVGLTAPLKNQMVITGSARVFEKAPTKTTSTGFGKRDSSDSILPPISRKNAKKGTVVVTGRIDPEAKKIFVGKQSQSSMVGQLGNTWGEFQPKKAEKVIRGE